MSTQRINGWPITALWAGALSLCLLGSSCAHAQQPTQPMPNTTQPAVITLDSLLHEMTDVSSLAKWPQAPYTTREASSYDRRTVAPDKPGWWANDDFSQYIRSEQNDGRKEEVMLDANGPGAIVRFWLTAGSPKQGTLRVYLDGSTEPTLTFNSFDLSAGGFQVPAALLYQHESHSDNAGGNTLYLPIPYAKHCKVTWEEGPKSGQRYYQIHYRTYPAGTPVKTFTPDQLQAASSLLESTGRSLNTPPQTVEGHLDSLNQKLGPHQIVTIELPPGPAAIRMLELLLDAGPLSPNETEQALRSVIIQLSFDGQRTVWCPATDFFGSGVGINELRNFYHTVSRDGTMRCRWVMPYQKIARIRLENLGDSPVMATLHATTSPWTWDDHTMHFHANWHYEKGMKTIPSGQVMENTAIRDWNFIHVQGKGVYVGDSLALYNPVPTWYGEGDEKIFVDGEAFPSHMGTGTEDYYGYSYAPRGVFQTPFVNHTRIDSPSTQGYNIMGRVRPLDAIPFQNSLKFDIELISWSPSLVTYAATTYWYGFPGATTNVPPQPEAATLPVQTLAGALAELLAGRTPKPGAIDAETLKVLAHSEGFAPEPQDMSPWGEENWSRGYQLLGKTNRVGDYIEVEVPAPDNAPHQIKVYATQASDYGILSFTVNGQKSATTFDGYAPQVQLGQPVNLGTFTPRDGKYIVRVEVSGSNPQARGARTYFGLDYLQLGAP